MQGRRTAIPKIGILVAPLKPFLGMDMSTWGRRHGWDAKMLVCE
jgi:hypothetical protein